MRKTLIASLVLAAACINEESPDQVKDLRILAMRLDPPELLFSFLHITDPAQRAGLTLGPYNMTAQVLAVDPQGREVTLTTRLCPEAAEEPCRGYRLRDNAPPDQINAVRPHLDLRTFVRSTDLSLGGELSVPSLSYTFTGPAVDYMVPHTPDGDLDFLGLLFPSMPYFVAHAYLPGTNEDEIAIKRFQLSMDISPAGLPPEAREAVEQLFSGVVGMDFCPPETPLDADVQCVKPRVANRNPTLARVLYRFGGGGDGPPGQQEEGVDPADVTSGGTFQDFTGRLVVTAGENLTIRPVVPAHDREPYQSFQFDSRTGKISVKNYKEDMAYSWFQTAGSIQQTTSEQNGFAAFTGRDAGFDASLPDTTWQVSPDAPEGPAFVWVVVRDQRGGVDWRRLDFTVVQPTATPGGEGGGPFGGLFGGGGGGGGGGPFGGRGN
ncbi:MAG: hypothetical protein AB2A00_32920 [Myxococcota bacterium]